jgi:polysaccharide deacetylase family protein (PEP-CTERM system associated)
MKILTFDVEDWFHLLDVDSSRTETDWSRYESRLQKNMERVFSVLEKHRVGATFFCLGWVAEKHPDIVRTIDRLGYEIGSHGHSHQLVYEQGQRGFRTDVERSIRTIEDLIGKKVRIFRAPGFSITEKTLWAFPVLSDLGIDIDSSVFPGIRGHGGFASYGASSPNILSYGGINIKEFPVSSKTVLSKKIFFSGGGYFRLLPYSLIRSWSGASDYMMAYFHPRDFDPGQPMMPGLPLDRRFKSYVGLGRSKEKLERLLADFGFSDIGTASKTIDWRTVPQIRF